MGDAAVPGGRGVQWRQTTSKAAEPRPAVPAAEEPRGDDLCPGKKGFHVSSRLALRAARRRASRAELDAGEPRRRRSEPRAVRSPGHAPVTPPQPRSRPLARPGSPGHAPRSPGHAPATPPPPAARLPLSFPTEWKVKLSGKPGPRSASEGAGRPRGCVWRRRRRRRRQGTRPAAAPRAFAGRVLRPRRGRFSWRIPERQRCSVYELSDTGHSAGGRAESDPLPRVRVAGPGALSVPAGWQVCSRSGALRPSRCEEVRSTRTPITHAVHMHPRARVQVCPLTWAHPLLCNRNRKQHRQSTACSRWYVAE